MNGRAPLPGLVLHEDWLPREDADRALASLLETVPWQQDHITLFGRRIAQPRLTAWMGDEDAVYTYSGLTLEPVPWSPAVAEVRRHVEATVGASFNSVLLNLYRTGDDSMGFHADDEPELGDDPLIASVSLGAVRRFVLRARKKKGTTPPVAMDLPHGSLLVIEGKVQREWVHGIPKRRAVRDPRVNLTFRRISALSR